MESKKSKKKGKKGKVMKNQSGNLEESTSDIVSASMMNIGNDTENSVDLSLPIPQQMKGNSDKSHDDPGLATGTQESSHQESFKDASVVNPIVDESVKNNCQNCDCREGLIHNLQEVRTEIEEKILETEKEYDRHQEQVSQMIESQAKHLSRIISDISKKEDNILELDKEYQKIESSVAELREAQKELTRKSKQNAKEKQNLEREKEILEGKGEAKLALAKKQGEDLSQTLQQLNNDLKENIKSIEDLDIGASRVAENKNDFLDFLSNSIKEKEADLECPVCLETAEIPIYTCHQMHLICSKCRPKLNVCPEDREEYQDMRRHRYAEKTSEELKKLKEMLVENSNEKETCYLNKNGKNTSINP